jgi:transporter family-2 protein
MPIEYLLALVIGVLVALQPAINNDLRTLLDGSVAAATLVSFLVGAAVMALLCLGGQRYAAFAQLPQAQWWQLTGGILGAGIVYGGIVLAPRIGLASMTALIVTGQVGASLLFDRMGLMGLEPRPLSLARIAGALLVVAGVIVFSSSGRR